MPWFTTCRKKKKHDIRAVENERFAFRHAFRRNLSAKIPRATFFIIISIARGTIELFADVDCYNIRFVNDLFRRYAPRRGDWASLPRSTSINHPLLAAPLGGAVGSSWRVHFSISRYL